MRTRPAPFAVLATAALTACLAAGCADPGADSAAGAGPTTPAPRSMPPDGFLPPSPAPPDTRGGTPDQSGTPCSPAERAAMFPSPTPYAGLTVAQLQAKLGAATPIRVIGADDRCFTLTLDLQAGRVNVYLTDGKITASFTETV